ncbi:hypothetical protein CAI16_11105 [Virgibacillus dokdonensis]|uniref:Sec-independent protein translocase protein TatA n=1 Tax=Virgibacillus dokdonensis TaxID=302167 RepID=A0A3E0WRG5_9BACI|nr:twin-arginine translocase TatA/TatE family subunit [Virgibacillus dokdonensis]RFA34576.1 hypothetical protein CAI16_11105 [Virgibacillus dokdonensis]
MKFQIDERRTYILFIALIVFGSSKLPELGKVVGVTLKEFKKSTRELVSEDEAKEEKIINWPFSMLS